MLHLRGSGGGGGGGGSSLGGVDLVANEIQTQPPMLTLKQFLANQDDSISDSDAITKYNEYKQDFRRQQLNEFFVTHKDEEWFKIKYHPHESLHRKEEQLNFLKRRADVFTEQLDIGSVAAASVDTTQTEKLLRLLDTVVIKLEGGTDDDLKVLDEKPVEPRGMDAVYQAKSTATATATSAAATFATVVAKPATDAKTETVADKPKPTTVDEENWDDDDDDAKKAAEPKTTDTDDAAPSSPGKKNPFAVRNDGAESAPTDATNADDAPQSPDGDDGTTKEPDAPVAKKRKRSNGSESSSSSSSSSSSDDEDDEHKAKAADAEEKAGDAVPTAGDDVEADDVAPVAAEKNGTAEQKSADPNDADANTQKDGGSDAAAVASVTDTPAAAEAPPAADTIETIDLDKEEAGVAAKPDAPLKALHRTSSIFLRNLAPTITKAEVEATCRRYAGFLRVAIADPLVERRWFRRGWVTFERDVNIKEICWNLNNIRLRDCELGAIVNRDLSRRVRPINGITGHRQIVRNDIKLCAKIAINLDARAGLWTLEGADTGAAANGGGGDEAMVSFGLHSSNPVLQNITDYLIEEASAEEDELLGYSSTSGGGGGETTAAAAAAGGDAGAAEALDRDPQLIAVLDRLILYLRVVHSVDFYNHCEYPYEDEMPNRCGIIHARGPAPQQRVTQQELQEYQRSFEGKMSSFLARAQPLAEAELRALGSKDAEGEVEKFVVANTQELAKDKWLCPLSGKKFKGPDFIRKHIFNKHAEKVDEVRKEVEYFNNYLKDPKRPQLPEHPGNQRRPAPPTGGGGGGGGGESASGGRGEGGPPHHGYRPSFHVPGGYGGYGGGYGGPMVAPRPRGGGFGGRRELPSDHQRRIIGYQDLDAPDYDFFP